MARMRQSGLHALRFMCPGNFHSKACALGISRQALSSLRVKALLPNSWLLGFLRVRIYTQRVTTSCGDPSGYVHESIRSHNSQPPVNWLTASDAENRPAAAGRISRLHLQNKTARALCAKRWELELRHKAHTTRRFRTQLPWSPPPRRPRCRKPTRPSSAHKTLLERCYQSSSTRAGLRNNSSRHKEDSSSRAAALLD